MDLPPSRIEPGARGVFLGYDFHFADAHSQLIEINTNAGEGFAPVLIEG